MEPLKRLLNRRAALLAACVCLWTGTAATDAPAAGGRDSAEAATLELKGLLVPLDSANLSSRSTGVIRSMKREGDVIKQDDIVVSLDDDTEKLTVKSCEAVLEVREFEARTSRTLQKQGSDSESNARTAAANLKTAQIQLEQAKVALEKKAVHAPFEGVVTRRIRAVGEATDNYLPLLTMVDLSKVYLETFLPANRLRDVRPDMSVEVRVPDLPGRTFKGQVQYIAPVIDPASGEFRVKILLDNSDRSLRSGMPAIGLLPVTRTELSVEGAPTPRADNSARR